MAILFVFRRIHIVSLERTKLQREIEKKDKGQPSAKAKQRKMPWNVAPFPVGHGITPIARNAWTAIGTTKLALNPYIAMCVSCCSYWSR